MATKNFDRLAEPALRNREACIEATRIAAQSVSGLVKKLDRMDEAEARFWQEHPNRHARYNHSEKGKARYRRYEQRRYQRLVAEGVCVRCRKSPATGLTVRCIECTSDRMFELRV
jgi:hypothetical protein